MKLTKLVQSCLLIEHGGKKFLVDPGSYSWQSGLVGKNDLKNIDAVIVTHTHADHLDEKFAKAVKKGSPKAKWYGTKQVADQLKKWGIKASTSSKDPDIKFIESEHANLLPFFPAQPDHTSFVLFGDILIGGDTHTLMDSHGARVFGGAVNGGPWGALVGFVQMIEAMENRPDVVVPLHDWHWHEDAQRSAYEALPRVLAQFDVKFVPLENGKRQEV